MIRFFLKLLLTLSLVLLVLLFSSLYEQKFNQMASAIKSATKKFTNTKSVAKVRDWSKEHVPRIELSRPEPKGKVSQPKKIAVREKPAPKTHEHISNEERKALEKLLPEN